MKSIFTLIFCLSISAFGQIQNECNCPSNKYADIKSQRIFNLTNGKRIALCGSVEKKGEDRFSEFVLAECGQNDIIGFWDAQTVCKITTDKNTLVIEELKSLPTGSNFSFQQTVWIVELITFNQEVKRENYLNRKIRKYNRAEIKNVLTEFESVKRKLRYSDMDLINKLFVAAISGDKNARKYLTDEGNFEPMDGAFAEDYKELIAMLHNWDK